ncbi:MAG TPA: hypothetical protein PLL50_10725 [Propionicimonas sp.]|mgnify:FL=1|nr:hypothetical protein [Propionicimonas sp.]HQA78815.1 hypothetical protein [Propionicimonas sp.]HQD96640.1 hypothetical protein [Propionicimonas sp.]
MKVLSKLSLSLGLVALLAGIGVLVWGSWIAYWHYATLSTGRSAEFQDPIPIIAIAAFVIAVGAFLTGLAVAAPRKVYPANQTVDPTV